MTNEMTSRMRPRLGRSPAYPAIGLELAVDRVRQVRAAIGNHAAHVDAIIAVWGLSPRGSISRQTVAALRYFGLLDFDGRGDDRQAKVSRLALDILLTEEGSREKLSAIQEAALKPTIHAAIWEEYRGSLPESDHSLELELIRNRGFNDNTVGDFIRQFKGTLDFAILTARMEPVDAQDKSEESDERKPEESVERDEQFTDEQTEMNVGTDFRSIPLPVSTGEWPSIRLPYPMTEQSWKEMFTVLNAMKPGIVTPTVPKISSTKLSEDDVD